MAFWLASDHPEQVGKLVNVDSLPALGAVMNPDLTPEQLKVNGEKMRAQMMSGTEAEHLQHTRAAVESMVTKPADVEMIYGWGKASDGATVANAMGELMGMDLRDSIANIKSPALALGTWIEYAQYAKKEDILKNFELQYKNLRGVEIELAPNARHFIMYDDPQWMFTQMDKFLGGAAERKQ